MHLLFDLDGTLTDSREGIVRSIAHALVHLRAEVPPADDLVRYVGPPLAGSFAALLRTDDVTLIERAVAAYRERYERVGILENSVYPGVPDALAELGGAGHRLGVVTAKPRVYACRILEHFELADRFECVYGPELGDRQYSKESLIRAACSTEGVRPATSIMIGDRGEDVLGARANGLRSIGVTWGYGTRAELMAARPDDIADSVEELVGFIGVRANSRGGGRIVGLRNQPARPFRHRV